MSKRDYLERVLREAMDKEDIDAVIGVSPENVQHLAGVFIASQRMIRDRLAFAVYRRKGPPMFVVSTVVKYTAKSKSWIDDVITYTEHVDMPVDGLAKALVDAGLGEGRIWMEMGALPARDADRLRAKLPKLTLIDAEKVLDRTRMIKSPEEIAFMSGIIGNWERSIRDGFAAAREGDSERKVADSIIANIHANGADWVPFIIFNSGEHTLINHWTPDATPLSKGRIIMVDMVGFFGGYYTDSARMAIVGEPTAAQRDAYKRMRTVQREMIKLVKPGVVGRDVYAHAVAVSRDLGMAFSGPDVGHSLGIRLHEYPILSPDQNEPLAKDMVVCIETSQLFEGLGRFHIEDTVLITDNGAKILTSLMDTEEMAVIN